MQIMPIKKEEAGLILIFVSHLLIKISKPCYTNLTVSPTLVGDSKATVQSVWSTKHSMVITYFNFSSLSHSVLAHAVIYTVSYIYTCPLTSMS